MLAQNRWLNGKTPASAAWRTLAADNFAGYRLKIGGLVENPVALSLAGQQSMALEQTIPLHHGLQGWSGIAEWGGRPIRKIVELIKPHAAATTVVFYSCGEGLYGGV